MSDQVAWRDQFYYGMKPEGAQQQQALEDAQQPGPMVPAPHQIHRQSEEAEDELSALRRSLADLQTAAEPSPANSSLSVLKAGTYEYQKPKYSRNEQGVITRTGGQEIEAAYMESQQAIKNGLYEQYLQMQEQPDQQPEPQHSPQQHHQQLSRDNKPKNEFGLRVPAYETDESLAASRFGKRQQVAAPEVHYQPDDSHDSFKHYGRGLQWNANQDKIAHGAMSRMNRAGTMETEDLFSSFLNEVQPPTAMASQSWQTTSFTPATAGLSLPADMPADAAEAAC